MPEPCLAGRVEAPAPRSAAATSSATRRILCVVVNLNRRDVLLRCVERLLHRVVVPPGHRLEVLVVDNGSADGSRAAVKTRFPAVAVINTGGNLGGSGAFRLGLRHAIDHGYDLVWLHDNDAFSSRRILEHYIFALEQLGGEAIVGGSMHQLEAPRRLNEAGGFFGRDRLVDVNLPLLGRRSTPGFRRGESPIDVDYLAFANALMPVELVRRLGLPEDFFLHYDDIEFCLRARAAGYPVAAVPAAVFWHESWLAKPKTWMQYYDTRNSLWTVALRLPRKLRRRRLIWLLSAAKNVIAGRPALATAILDGLRDQALGVKGRVDLDTSGFAAHDIAANGIEPLMAATGCRCLALDRRALQALPPAYRAPWLACLAALGDRAFLCDVNGGRVTLHPAANVPASAVAGGSLESLPAIGRAAKRRVAAEALLVRPARRTGPRARVVLRSFRRMLWLHGTHVVEHDRGATAGDSRRLAGRWLRSWTHVFQGTGGAR